MLDTIAFDADDTLWHTETLYRRVERRLTEILASYGVAAGETLEVLHRIEVDNLAYFGYGIRGFLLSMIETATRVTGGAVRGADVQAIVDMGREMTGHPVALLEGVEETLAGLDGRRLMIITKGDVLDQESKIRRSGLAHFFPLVEILIDKTPAAYADLFARHAIDPGRFLMVGNSLRSDIVPILALGGYAVHVPYPDSWAHESEAELPEDRAHFFEIGSLRELAGVLEKIEATGRPA
ncbi:MAG: HAD family hydrolase [Chloroflexi bacterium]|jgi:putative hydrolase of the HAD superfamily|nr:HAD family hydrolase [Anaerolineaceae bacterium]NMB86975.1 HAD family hydrolase [Chloroflexota bacterium]